MFDVLGINVPGHCFAASTPLSCNTNQPPPPPSSPGGKSALLSATNNFKNFVCCVSYRIIIGQRQVCHDTCNKFFKKGAVGKVFEAGG